MNLTKTVLLLSTLTFGASHAMGTVPCNAFKIYLKNHAQEKLVVDSVYLSDGTISSVDPQLIEVNKNALYTVNSTNEGSVMQGEFLVHTLSDPKKELKINFSLTNKNVFCEVGNKSQAGALNTSFRRLLGGLSLPISQ